MVRAPHQAQSRLTLLHHRDSDEQPFGLGTVRLLFPRAKSSGSRSYKCTTERSSQFRLVAIVALLAALVHARTNQVQRRLAEHRDADHLDHLARRQDSRPTQFFDQIIDHANTSLGTFKQRYWVSDEFYKSGGPVILYSPGEDNAETYQIYLTNERISGMIAQATNALIVLFELRFFGLSNPFGDLSSASLKYHTVQQAIDDYAYFAQNVKLPVSDADQLTADKTPWILVGGSYPGALVAWTMVNKPGVFHAGYATAAPVQGIIDFWRYHEPIRENMPQNCSTDVQAVIAHVDDVLTNGTEQEIQDLLNNWGVGSLSHKEDIGTSLRVNLQDWQYLHPESGAGTRFYNFCDALEVKDGVSAGPDGWGLDHALQAWGKHWNDTYYKLICNDKDAESCLSNWNPENPFWTNTTIDNHIRSYWWLTCNELGFYQGGAPMDQHTLVSRLVTPEYELRECTYFFPEAFKTTPTPRTNELNEAYGGWDLDVDRLFLSNGKRDPWRDATVSSVLHTRNSTDRMPIMVSDAFHCSDLRAAAGRVDQTVADVQNAGIAKMKDWLMEWEGNITQWEGNITQWGSNTSKREFRSAKFGRILADADAL